MGGLGRKKGKPGIKKNMSALAVLINFEKNENHVTTLRGTGKSSTAQYSI